ncbi:MAG: phospholipid carrier-dependent glycosyltransferase [Thiotrichales bacterium]|nr:phospholipid carrier-dependent glycosyltransferase [Thiotrichales bacterium]
MNAGRWNLLWFLFFALLLVRFSLLGAYPLMDTTEARYAEIARKMVELNDWITPWFAPEVPFWGKPPLSFWATALSFKLFGVHEFSARLPHFLAGLLILGLLHRWVQKRSADLANTFTLLLGSSLLFFAASGLVMTDIWLLFAVVLAMIAFWDALPCPPGQAAPAQTLAPIWFFVGLGLGLLAKGPLILVLVGFPVLIWLIYQRDWRSVWRALPWMWGSLLVFLIAVPWYLLAEWKTPGFLNYFILGEHFYRFTVPGWQGDLYGSAHLQPKGTIWLYAWVDLLPWALLVPIWLLFRLLPKRVDSAPTPPVQANWSIYLLSFALTPLLFFSFAGNILWPYVLPAVPALLLLLAQQIEARTAKNPEVKQRFLLSGLLSMLAMLVLLAGIYQYDHRGERKSEKFLIEHYQQLQQGQPLVYWQNKPFSASFYSANQALQVQDWPALESLLLEHSELFLAIRPKALSLLPAEYKAHLHFEQTFGRYHLYRLSAKGPLVPPIESMPSTEGALNWKVPVEKAS